MPRASILLYGEVVHSGGCHAQRTSVVRNREWKRMATRKKAHLSLGDESFGEKIHRAYRIGRRKYGFTYSEVAERIRPIYPISDQALQRMAEEIESLEQASSRQRIWLFLMLLAYGFEPSEFGIEDGSVSLDPEVVKLARRRLSPTSSCSSRHQASHTTTDSRVPAGQRVDRRIAMRRAVA